MLDRPNHNPLLRTLLSLAAAALLTGSATARAATYQVGPNRAYPSLQAVSGALAAGDVVEVDGDATYPGGVDLNNSGTAAQPITIRGLRVNGKRPVFSGGTNTLHVYASHYLFEGLEITGGASRCFFHHGDDVTIRDSVVHDCPNHGILGADSESGSLTLDYVEIYACGAADQKHPVYMATDETVHPGSVFRMQHCYLHDQNGGHNVKSRAERNEIYGNWIEGGLYHELELIGPDGQDEGLAREDSDVVGNVLYKTNDFYVTRLGGDGTGQTWGRYRFVGNTIVIQPGGRAAFRLFDGIESLEAHNNVFVQLGGGPLAVIHDGDATWSTGAAVYAGSNNWLATGGTTVPAPWTGTTESADPGLVALAARDLHVASGSQLVDAGDQAPASPPGFPFTNPLPQPLYLPPPHALEAVGTAALRPIDGHIDIGAYELGGAGGQGQGASSGALTTGLSGAQGGTGSVDLSAATGGGAGGQGACGAQGGTCASGGGVADTGSLPGHGGCACAAGADPRGSALGAASAVLLGLVVAGSARGRRRR